MNIIRAGLNDLEPVADLFNQYRQFYRQEPDLDGCREFLRDRLARNESVIFVAWTGDHDAAGFTQLYPSFCSVALKPILYLYDLFVAPRFRRQGVGRMLMEEAAVFARQVRADRLTLETAIDNFPGQALYESMGYSKDEDFYTYHFEID